MQYQFVANNPFAVLTAITLTVMGIFYLRLPATLGIGNRAR